MLSPFPFDGGEPALFRLAFVFVPLIIFYGVLGTLEEGVGSEFKTKRIIAASVLWFVYLLAGVPLILRFLGNWPAIFLCHAMAIGLVVKLSYEIGNRFGPKPEDK